MNLQSGACLLLLCSAVQPLSQLAAAPGNHPITLEVVVTGKDGKPVPGLNQQDFTLTDNKKPQKLDFFQGVEGSSAGAAGTVVVETILLVDRVNPSYEVANDERTRLLKYLRQNDGKLAQPLSMVFFSESGTKIQPASRDGNVLAAALEQSDNSLRTSRRAQGMQGYIEMGQMSIRALNSIAAFEEKKPGRKMLIWISPGWPPISSPQFIPGPEQHKQFFDSIIATTNALVRAHVTIYSVDPVGMEDASQFRTGYYDPYLKPVTTPSKAQGDNLALQVFVNHTGGRSLSASNDIGAQIENCLGDLSAYYIVSFTSPPADGPNEYHAIEVKIDKPGLKARTLTGYYAQP